MTFAPQRNVPDVLLSWRLHTPFASVLKLFLNPKLDSLNGAFLEQRAGPKAPDEDPLGSLDLVTVPVWIHWCFYTATPFFCSCFPNLLNSALPNTGPPADPSDLLRSSRLSREKSTDGKSSIVIPKHLPHLRASSAWCHVSPLRVCHV